MRLTPLHRTVAALAAAFFLLGGAEHWFGFEPCPHHEGAALSAFAPDAADHGGHAHHGGPSDGSQSDSEEHGPCDCIGPCAAPSPPALPATASVAVDASVERVESSVSRARDFVAPRFVPYLLPYAHAPPSLG